MQRRLNNEVQKQLTLEDMKRNKNETEKRDL